MQIIQPLVVEPEVPKIEIVELAPIDPDEDFSDIYLGVKDEFVEGKCKVMALKGEDPFFATFSTRNLVKILKNFYNIMVKMMY